MGYVATVSITPPSAGITRSADAIGAPETYYWLVRHNSWNHSGLDKRKFYDRDHHNDRGRSLGAAAHFLSEVPPESSHKKAPINEHAWRTPRGHQVTGLRHVYLRRSKSKATGTYYWSFSARRAGKRWQKALWRSPRVHGIFPALEMVCRHNARRHIKEEIPRGMKIEDVMSKREIRDASDYYADMQLRVAWPRIRKFMLKNHQLFDWPHPDTHNPGTIRT